MSAKPAKPGSGPVIMAANDLIDGLSVYLDKNHAWIKEYSKAVIVENEADAKALLAKAAHDEAENIVVGAYLIAIDIETGLPVRNRERMRVSGPTHGPTQFESTRKAES